jgi:hypothetical protein
MWAKTYHATRSVSATLRSAAVQTGRASPVGEVRARFLSGSNKRLEKGSFGFAAASTAGAANGAEPKAADLMMSLRSLARPGRLEGLLPQGSHRSRRAH